MDDESNLQEFEEPTDIGGTFELHVLEYTEVLDQSCPLFTTEPEWDSLDDETLASERRRMLPAIDKLISTVPISDEFRSGEEIKNTLSEKTPLELFFMFFDDEMIDLILNFALRYAQDNDCHEFSSSKNGRNLSYKEM
ncbi:hypothetical protein JTB14_020638 [Gonioctena quinquepunctata]|nr:hypothetical protein JTB14_020638 [Gonioctena quinquepunctata]